MLSPWELTIIMTTLTTVTTSRRYSWIFSGEDRRLNRVHPLQAETGQLTPNRQVLFVLPAQVSTVRERARHHEVIESVTDLIAEALRQHQVFDFIVLVNLAEADAVDDLGLVVLA